MIKRLKNQLHLLTIDNFTGHLVFGDHNVFSDSFFFLHFAPKIVDFTCSQKSYFELILLNKNVKNELENIMAVWNKQFLKN